MAKKTVDVETIDILLMGDEDEIGEAIRLIDLHFREKIVEIIRRKALSADQDDLFDIYQNVMLSILEHGLKGNHDPNVQKLEGLIYRIACRRAIDWIRHKSGIIEDCNTDAIVESTKEIICGSKYEESWRIAQSEEKRQLILETILYLIPKLKRRQRQVAEIIYSNFPDFLELSDIKNKILEIYGEDLTIPAIKQARREVYSKLKDAFSIAGYGDYIDD